MEKLFLFYYMVAGLCIGSFLNVVMYRLPREMPMGVARSVCPVCGQTLQARDLVPLLSFFCLKGHCRMCHAPISYSYPLVEGLTAAVFGLCCFRLGANGYSLFMCAFACVLIVAAGIDLLFQIIPNECPLCILILAVLCQFFYPQITLADAFFGGGSVFAVMLLLSYVSHGGIGGGDIKLMAASGFLLGFTHNVAAFFLAYVIALFFCIPALLQGRLQKNSQIPMAPFFGAALLLVVLNAGMPAV